MTCLPFRISTSSIGIAILFKLILIFLVSGMCAGCGNGNLDSNAYLEKQPPPGQIEIKVTHFFPDGYVTDGSVGYVPQLQMALRYAARWNLAVVFPPMTYLIDTEQGLEVYSGLTLNMHGAVLKTATSFSTDGQVFWGQEITNVTFNGGEIYGSRDLWSDSTNIVGINILGSSTNISILDIYLHHLSSNAVRISGTGPSNPARNITIRNLHADHCCGVYIDYLQPNKGPAPGTSREDTGNIAFFYVEGFNIEFCLLERSHADGTHFYRSSHGRFSNNILRDNHMGGYFLEGSSYIDADSNTITASGSRGVTFEAKSIYNTLTNNIISNSGREGFWSTSSSYCNIIGNTFSDNGRKDDSTVDGNILIENAMGAFSHEVQTQNLLIEGNTLVTSSFQSWAIRTTSTCSGIRIQHNELLGDNRIIRNDAWLSGIGTVSVTDNKGWQTENSGIIQFTGNGSTTKFTIPHGLDFIDAILPKFITIVPVILVTGLTSEFRFDYTYDVKNLIITFNNPPPAGMKFQVDWSAAITQQIL